VLAIEGDVVQLLELQWPLGILGYIVLAASTGYLFLENAWFQNKLTGFKNSYEERWR
jgi:hypothetical protein